MNVTFTDNSIVVKEALNDAVNAFLYEVGGEVASRAVRNSRVDTGELQGSWKYKVNEAKKEVKIGSNLENAIWEEFGTGQYALNGNGRKTSWAYKDSDGEWHKTSGKRPNRTLNNAIDPIKGKLNRVLADKVKGAMNG